MVRMTPLTYGILILVGGWIAIYLLFRGIRALDTPFDIPDLTEPQDPHE